MKALIARFSCPFTTTRSTCPLPFFQMLRSARLSCVSVSAESDGNPPLPGTNLLLAINATIPFIVRRTLAEPSGLAAGERPLITQFSRSRKSSRSRCCFW